MEHTPQRASHERRDTQAPLDERSDADIQGHRLLARLGKHVLRPGGAELTKILLAWAGVTGADVIELAPGRGLTAREIIDLRPRSYVGIDSDPQAVDAVRGIVAEHGTVAVADAAATGLPDGSADVVLGEAMLTMQGDKAKNAIVAEAARILRPGGGYAIHELGLTPDALPGDVKARIRQTLARSIKVNARPYTIAEWRSLLESHGLVVEHVATAAMALLQPRRLAADEGVCGAARFAKNLLTHPDARRRVLSIRRAFRTHRNYLIGVAIVARKTGTRAPRAAT
ncbi:class I SAM-dependent methyltransferase [Nonomuraea sediminis]|uniref:class I SAM-dependent methyltransferase n=1 Tax=Nonomuraea sediminis TaxID=2835864 RepID=UPI001BDD6722|nr:class I SAM-dependent methyltransferase [Nonomuraea sediminis]